MKNKMLILISALAVICVGIVFFAGSKVAGTKKDLDQERYSRMVAEEKLEKALIKIRSLENEVNVAQTQTQNLQAVFDKEKAASSKAQTELDKMTKLKEVLEKELKNALVPPAATEQAPQPPPG